MGKRTVFLIDQPRRDFAMRLVSEAPQGHAVTISEPTRSLDQNAKLWPMLGDVAYQVEWYGRKLTPAEWKDVFTAALIKADVVPGIDGGFVVLGQRTSTMSKRRFSELVELIYAFGAERGVMWSEPVS